MSPSTSVFLVLALASHLAFTSAFSSSGSVHVWRGKIVYYGGSKEMSLHEAFTTCSNLGGQLPSVHSAQDINELTHLIGQEARLWLGAKPRPKLAPTAALGTYEWEDGTPFDYHGWVRGYPQCSTACCGLGFTTVYEDGLVDKDCSIQRRLICIMPVMTNATAQAWLESQLEELTAHINTTSLVDIEQQLALEMLNETLTSIAENTHLIFFKYAALNNTLYRELEKLNGTVKTNENSLNQLLIDARDTLSRQTTAAALKSQQNESELSSLTVRINICFIMLSFICIVLLITLIIKSNILSWVPLSKSNIYTRFREPRINNFRSSSLRTNLSTSSNSFPNPNADPDVGLDSYYSQPVDIQERV